MMNYSTSTPSLNTSDYYDDYYYPHGASTCSMEKIKTFTSVVFAVLYSLLFVFGLVGNFLVIWILVACKKLTSVTDVYLLNLAISDLLFVFSLPFLAYYSLGQWIFGNIMCKIVCGSYYIGFYSGIFLITVMSVDRYLSIVHTIHALKIRTVLRGIIISMALWVCALLISIPNLIYIKEVIDDNATKCVPYYADNNQIWKLLTNFEVNIMGLLIPLGILIFCYSHILKNLKKCQTCNRYKAIKLVFVVVIVFFLFWTPYNIMLFLDSLRSLHIIDDCETSKKLDVALEVTEVLSFIHCCLNPVIYAFVGERFKKYLHELFGKHTRFFLICKNHSIFQSYRSFRSTTVHASSSHTSSVDHVL
ncbi:PREDICTED: C-C chemokine receptor type 8-like [Crocodylus porosus]|uniref:C-C chemokine receptor type 8-like n=1 Tax=Crocodylus porosus TaxID=8502 RepID=UPI00093DE1C2|nr:PREDICTED: C-C chemokine receptor type 8-like [Crocodylus porosus]